MPISSAMAGGSKIGTGGGGSKVDILIAITLLAKGLKEATKVQKQLKGLNDETKKTGESSDKASKSTLTFGNALKTLGGIAGVTVATFAGVAKAIEVALAVGAEGAKYRQMEQSFETLNRVVAPNIDLLHELGEASLNTTSKFEMMNAASVALAGLTGEFGGQMAEALPQLLRIAKASEKLNPALGDTGFLFQSLTIGLKRLSPRLIDNTGLQIRLSEAYGKLAKELGKAPNELTSVEQQMALLNATLAAGDVLIQQAGGNVASLTDVYSRFNANIENSKNTLKGLFDELFGRKLASSLNILIFGMQMLDDQFDGIALSARDASVNYEAYIKAAAQVALANNDITATQARLLSEWVDPDIELDASQVAMVARLALELGLLTEAAFEAGNAADGVTSAYENYLNTVLNAAIISKNMSQGQADLIRDIQLFGMTAEEAMEKYGAGMIAGNHITDEAIHTTEGFTQGVIALMHSLGLVTAAEQKDMAAKQKKIKVMQSYVSEMDKIYIAAGLVAEVNDDVSESEEKAEASILGLAGAMKLAKDDTEKVRIATELFGVTLNAGSEALYRHEAELLRNKLAIEELTDEERSATQAELNLTLAKLDAVDASKKLSDAEDDLKEETRKLADEARNAKTAFQTMFEGINLNLPSLAGGFIEDIEFLLVGGVDLQKQIELVGLAMKRELIPPDKALEIFEQLFVKSQALSIELDDIGKWDAIATIADQLGISFDDAAIALQDIGDVDIFGMLAEDIDPNVFLAPFKSLPDNLQALFSEALDVFEATVEVNYIPAVSEEDAANLFDNIPEFEELDAKEIPINLIPQLAKEGLVDGDFKVNVGTELTDEAQAMMDWIKEGETKTTEATVATSFVPELGSEMQKLLGDETVSQSANVSVTDDIDANLNSLLASSVLNRTIHVTVVTTETTSDGRAGGGRIVGDKVYQVGEIRPELFVSDTAGRMMMNTRNPYADNTTDFATHPTVPIMQPPSSISVAINNPTISNDYDLDLLSYEIAKKISERQQGRM